MSAALLFGDVIKVAIWQDGAKKTPVPQLGRLGFLSFKNGFICMSDSETGKAFAG